MDSSWGSATRTKKENIQVSRGKKYAGELAAQAHQDILQEVLDIDTEHGALVCHHAHQAVQ
jgi:hypothetical protein